jgi:hypothetical protein
MRIGLILTVALLVAGQAMADLQELSQTELRNAVGESRAIRTHVLITGVERFTGGSVVDIRAFENNGAIIYRVLYRGDDKSIHTLMVDGETGRSVSPESDEGSAVLRFATANPRETTSAASTTGQRPIAGTRVSNAGQSPRDNNAGGNNAGGNDRGNSGGNSGKGNGASGNNGNNGNGGGNGRSNGRNN